MTLSTQIVSIPKRMKMTQIIKEFLTSWWECDSPFHNIFQPVPHNLGYDPALLDRYQDIQVHINFIGIVVGGPLAAP